MKEFCDLYRKFDGDTLVFLCDALFRRCCFEFYCNTARASIVVGLLGLKGRDCDGTFHFLVSCDGVKQISLAAVEVTPMIMMLRTLKSDEQILCSSVCVTFLSVRHN